MKLLFLSVFFSAAALAHGNPTQDQIRLKLWYEGISQKPAPTRPRPEFKPQIEEIERPLSQLFSEE